MKSFLKHFVILSIVALSQVTILINLNSRLSNLDMILVVIIFVGIVYQFYLGIIYSLLLGFWVELFSPLPFGTTIICYLITMYFIYLIMQKILTNKSFYSLLGITFIGTIIYNCLFCFFSTIYYFITTKDYALVKIYSFTTLQNLSWQLALNLALAICLFLVFHLGSQRFKAVFIDTTKN